MRPPLRLRRASWERHGRDPERDPLQAELFEDPPQIANGTLMLKEQPGLGLKLSEAALQKFGERIL